MKTQREKGKTAERDVAKRLGKWWESVEPGCRFVPTPSSGGWHGRAGGQIRADFRASGDLMTTARRFPYAVEVKHRQGWAYESLLYCDDSPVWKWWQQAVGAADEMALQPMLWMRRNRGKWLVVLPAPKAAASMPAVGLLDRDRQLLILDALVLIGLPALPHALPPPELLHPRQLEMFR